MRLKTFWQYYSFGINLEFVSDLWLSSIFIPNFSLWFFIYKLSVTYSYSCLLTAIPWFNMCRNKFEESIAWFPFPDTFTSRKMCLAQIVTFTIASPWLLPFRVTFNKLRGHCFWSGSAFNPALSRALLSIPHFPLNWFPCLRLIKSAACDTRVQIYRTPRCKQWPLGDYTRALHKRRQTALEFSLGPPFSLAHQQLIEFTSTNWT